MPASSIGSAGSDSGGSLLQTVLNAAEARTNQAAARFRLSRADREDLYQELVLDMLERADRFDSSKGSLGTFTGVVSWHRATEFLNALKDDRARLSFCSGDEAANDSASNLEMGIDNAIAVMWAEDRDLFADAEVLRDLETALAYMNDDQRALFALLDTHDDVAEACRNWGQSTATFYRRVEALRMHLRMFGFRPAA